MRRQFNFKHLITEDNKNISLGRVSFWIVFLILFIYWIMDLYVVANCGEIIEVPDSLLYAFFSLLMYNTGKKISGSIMKRNEKLSKFYNDNLEEEKDDIDYKG